MFNISLRQQVASLLAVILLLPVAFAQTRIDLRTQSKSADLSSTGATKPVQTGTTMPPSCSAGQLFFRLDSPAGQNLYGCTATNIWTRLFYSTAGAYTVTFSGQVALVVPTSSHGIETANMSVDCYDAIYSPMPPSSVSIDSATLDVLITFDSARTGRCVLTATDDSTAGGGASAAVNAGVGLVMTESEGTKTLSLDTAVVPTLLLVSQSITAGSLQPGSCSQSEIVAAGAATGDGVAPGWPASLPAGITGIMWVTAANTISVRVCNSGSAPTPAITDIFRASLVRSF
jgi:hypothetical protein